MYANVAECSMIFMLPLIRLVSANPGREPIEEKWRCDDRNDKDPGDNHHNDDIYDSRIEAADRM